MANANTPGNNRTNAVRLPPALSPEQPGLTQPFRDFVARGWVSRIQYTVTPGSSTISVDLGDEVTLPEGKTNRVGLTPQVAKDLIIAAGLWQPGQKGTKTKSTKSGNALPLRSLCKEDFNGSDANLLSRIQSVAKNVGDQTARGRIGSLKMYKKGADTFAEWWKQAGPAQIGHLLVSKQHYEKLGVADFNRIKSVCPKSPFRGDKLPTPPEDSDDKDEPDEEPVKPPPTRNGKGGAAQPAGTSSQNGKQAKKEAAPKK